VTGDAADAAHPAAAPAADRQLPGAMAAGLLDPLFWGSLGVSLAVAFVVALPVNRWLVGRGLGHAVMHEEMRTG